MVLRPLGPGAGAAARTDGSHTRVGADSEDRHGTRAPGRERHGGATQDQEPRQRRSAKKGRVSGGGAGRVGVRANRSVRRTVKVPLKNNET
jgi:hypothetical protein